MTCGVLSLPRGAEKPNRNSDQSSMAFHVIYGCVRATVHKTTFVLKTGAHFVVPRGEKNSPCSPSCAVCV
ncbi:MAG: Mif2/CENP-C cupin domain-containing protein [Olpidium bornovanus]|uniref:Mif2/CENP-C cupin domain-containing protein n=1 Tax=Olpidium bornovanus TaxID=278681 RepID=A0A8H7ZPA1_9FUNG|nr:MAG: Mif2/CENP-C cupin domain-containing protein [Olpidium bornovanus]